MRILYVHRTAGTRVEGVHIRELVHAFRALGHEVLLVNPPGCNPMHRVEESCGSQKQGALRRIVGSLPRALPSVFFELLEILYSLFIAPYVLFQAICFKPNFIYERTASYQFAATLTGVIFRIPVIQEINQTVDIGRLRPTHLRRIAHWIERIVFAHSAALLTVSKRFRSLLIEGGYPPDKITVIPNAADVERFRPNLFPTPEVDAIHDGRVVLGYVGAFLKWHELNRMLDLLADCIHGQPLPIRLLLIGEGPELRGLQNRVTACGVGKDVMFPGPISHDKLPEWIQRMDVAVMANATEYASPVKLFEYMAMGKAIVAPRVPPVEEIVRDGETALLFTPGEARSFRETIERIVSDASLRKRLGNNAREGVIRNHTWLKNAERVMDVIQTLRYAKQNQRKRNK